MGNEEYARKISRIVPELKYPDIDLTNPIDGAEIERAARLLIRTARQIANSYDGALEVADVLDYALFGGDIGVPWGLTFYRLAEMIVYPRDIEDVIENE